MQKVPKDIDLITYRFIHRDIMKQLNSEYMRTIKVCSCVCCNKVCSSSIFVLFLGKHLVYNYRDLSVRYGNYTYVHDKWDFSCSELPINY